MDNTSRNSTAEIADAAGQPEHRAWNFLLLSPKYRPESRTRCEYEDFGDDGQDPSMPQFFRYVYDSTTADAAIADLALMVAKLGKFADKLYAVDDLAEVSGITMSVITQRLNIGWRNQNSESPWPVTFAPDGTPLFDGLVLELLRRRDSEVTPC